MSVCTHTPNPTGFAGLLVIYVATNPVIVSSRPQKSLGPYLPERWDAAVQRYLRFPLHPLDGLVKEVQRCLPVGQIARHKDVVVGRDDMSDEVINLPRQQRPPDEAVPHYRGTGTQGHERMDIISADEFLLNVRLFFCAMIKSAFAT